MKRAPEPKYLIWTSHKMKRSKLGNKVFLFIQVKIVHLSCFLFFWNASVNHRFISFFFHWKFSSRFLLYDECNFLCILASQKCFDYCCSGCCCCWPAWGPFIYYVSTWKGGGVKKLSLLLIFRTIKYAYIGGVKSL